MILAGDIGGTKTNLALYEWTTERVEPLRLESFPSGDYKTLEDILVEFLAPPKESSLVASPETQGETQSEKLVILPAEPVKLTAACFGIAGPVIDNRCQTTNLPWVIDGGTIAKQFDIPRVKLLNDLEAIAYGLLLAADRTRLKCSMRELHRHKRQAFALIAAGTGLGEGILFWDGKHIRRCRRREAMRILRRTMIKKSNCFAISAASTST